jgi:hypothetical protein
MDFRSCGNESIPLKQSVLKQATQAGCDPVSWCHDPVAVNLKLP